MENRATNECPHGFVIDKIDTGCSVCQEIADLQSKLQKAESESASYRVALEKWKDVDAFMSDEGATNRAKGVCLLAEARALTNEALTHPSPILDTLRECRGALEKMANEKCWLHSHIAQQALSKIKEVM